MITIGRLWCTGKKVDSRTGTNHSYMSHPLSHSELLRIIEKYLGSDLTKYATTREKVWKGNKLRETLSKGYMKKI